MQHIGSNPEEVKRRNLSLILNTLREVGPTCRRDLSRLAGLTPATISRLTAELIACSLVSEVGSDLDDERRGGPNPILLDLAAGGPCVLALRLGVTVPALHGALVDLHGKITAQKSLPLPQDHGVAELAQAAATLAKALSAPTVAGPANRPLAVGFATTGPVDEQEGMIQTHQNPRLCHARVGAPLRAALGLPVFVGNIVNSMALAEAWFGQGRNYANYLFMLVQDAVNGALVMQRSVLVGRRWGSCIVGHAPLDPQGPVCRLCGLRGCVNSLASDAALLAQARPLLDRPGSPLATLAASAPLSRRLIAAAARAGDEECRSLLVCQGTYLGRALANALNLIDVQAVILAMDVAEPEADIELGALRAAYEANLAYRGDNGDIPQILLSELKGELALLGPATLAIKQVLSPRLTIRTTPSGSLAASLFF